jgi:hypothetical protein
MPLLEGGDHRLVANDALRASQKLGCFRITVNKDMCISPRGGV